MSKSDSSLQSPFSVAQMFALFLVLLFVFQGGWAFWLIWERVGGVMERLQQEAEDTTLETYASSLESRLLSRLELMQSYLYLPIFTNMVLHPKQSIGNFSDTLDHLPFMERDVRAVLYDFRGRVLYATGDEVPIGENSAWFTGVMEHKDTSVDVITTSQGPAWQMSVPVLYNGLAEGVFSIVFPVQLNFLLQGDEVLDTRRIALLREDALVLDVGRVDGEFTTLKRDLCFVGFRLEMETSQAPIVASRNELLFGFVWVLVGGTLVLLVLFYRLGHQFIVSPHAKLATVSKALQEKSVELEEANSELEKRVMLRTKDLQRRGEALLEEIGERRKVEQSLAEQSDLLQKILLGIRAAILIMKEEGGEIVDANEIAEQLIGKTKHEIIGRCCGEFLVCDNSGENGACMLCASIEQGILDQEVLLRSASGENLPIRRSVLPVTIHETPHLAEIFFDISEQKEIERQLSHAQKMESIGQLAAGIAHEINTPIQYVGDNMRFLQESFSELLESVHVCSITLGEGAENVLGKDRVDAFTQTMEEAEVDFLTEEVPKAIEQALSGVERVATIVQAMKKFSHPDTDKQTTINLNSAIEDTVTVARNEWKYVAEVTMNLADDLPLIACFPGDMNQAVLNIIVNAAQAIAENTPAGEQPSGAIHITTQLDSDQVIITISDNGGGIPEDVQARIFDPFFTTKDVGLGTGQGLAITHDIIVKKHNGSVWFETEEGKGTTFIISLPVAGAA